MGDSKKVGMLLSIALALLVLAPPASASVQFHVKGRWTCQEPTVGTKPIAAARAELWRSRSYYPDEKIKTVFLDSDGRYDMKITASDNFELYVKMLLTDDNGVELENWYSPWTWKAETGKADSHSGTVDLGTYQISKDGSGSPKCAIWQGAHNAYGAYRSVVGARPPDNHYKIDAEYPCCGTPFTTRATTRWPGDFGVGVDYRVSIHEFAHSFRHSFDGGETHFLLDVARFQYPQFHAPCKHTNLGFAFNEGWAEYWSGDVPQDRCGGNRFDSEYEGNVAYQLTQLEGCSDRAAMVRVLRAAPGKIHSFAEYENQWRTQLGKGPCGYTPAPPGTGGGKPPPTTVPSQPEVLRQVRDQKQTVRALKRRAATARGRAKRPGRCTKGGCQAALERLIAPSALTVQAKQAHLVLDSLERGLAAARKAKFNPAAQYKIAAVLDARRDDFEQANQKIVVAGMKNGLKAIGDQRGFGRARGTDLFKTLRNRLRGLTRARRKGVGTPASVENLFSAPESPLENVRRVRGG